ncbi:hypothetical protein NQ317_002753 [Molorchus minor]|uniref:Retrotransposon gag domain-containing protein n=1 Tax=Molorchus minor TaxID=1323400 RepID=A0ABQ9J2B2_9CUCU|nr:hypothetical protein NQ317_002753 [Molorchus minor]
MAASYIGHLNKFDHVTSDWNIFLIQLKQYFKINKISEDIQKDLLLNSLSERTYKLVNHLCMPNSPDVKTFVELKILLDKHFSPITCFHSERMKFYGARRAENESVLDFATRLKSLAGNAGFDAVLSIVLRDIFILGIGKGPIQDRLKEEKPNVSFEKVLEIALGKEQSQIEANIRSKVKTEPESSMHHVSKGRKVQAGYSEAAKSRAAAGGSPRASNFRGKPGQRLPCKVCGRQNHETNTGFAFSAISEEFYLNNFADKKLLPSSIQLKEYVGHSFAPLGKINLHFTFEDISDSLECFVIKRGGPPLLIFEDELGLLKNQVLNMNVKSDATPKFFKHRSLPYALKTKVEAEIDRLVSLGILIPVEHSETRRTY